MRIIIQDTSKEHNTDSDALIRRKVRGLSRYAPVLKDAVVEVRHDRHHRKGAVASVEISLHLFCHGNLPIRATMSAGDIHTALDDALEKIGSSDFLMGTWLIYHNGRGWQSCNVQSF